MGGDACWPWFWKKKEREGEECNGSTVFFKGQKDRIVNLDETNGSLDNTHGQRGGSSSFFSFKMILMEVHRGQTRFLICLQ